MPGIESSPDRVTGRPAEFVGGRLLLTARGVYRLYWTRPAADEFTVLQAMAEAAAVTSAAGKDTGPDGW